MKTDKNIFLTGQAGTGKTTTINRYIEWAERNDINVALTASTGISAINIGGTTIHSFLGSKLANSIEEYNKLNVNKSNWKKIKENINKIDSLVIDEVSMLNAKYIDMIDYILKKATNISEPFGGKKVIFVGDFLQLPPISKNKEFAFDSKAWREAKIKILNLTKIHRQEDAEFVNILGKIRLGNIDELIINYLDRINYKKIENDDSVKLFAKNVNVDEFNKNELNKIKGRPKIYEAKITGKDSNYKKNIVKNVLANKILELKVGSRIMSLKNDYNHNFVNGSLGKIIQLNPKSVRVRFDNGFETTFGYEKWETFDLDGKVTASFEQIPLKLAYAITIHKSQGMTIDKLTIDCLGIFEEGQFYVAISRAKNKEGLKLVWFKTNHIRTNKRATSYYKRFLKTKAQPQK